MTEGVARYAHTGNRVDSGTNTNEQTEYGRVLAAYETELGERYPGATGTLIGW